MILKINISLHFYVHRNNDSEVKNEQKEEIQAQTTQTCFFTFAENEINYLRKMNHQSTADNYATAIRSLIRYYGQRELPLSAIDSRLMDAYGEWLRKERIEKNTLSCYMRSLRAIYNKAVERDLVEQRNPFRNVFTGITRTKKRSIEKEDISKLREAELKPRSFMQLVRDIFLFCFYACGMPFIDVAFLKRSQIVDGYISYNRRKTDQFVQIKIEPCMEEIINRYKSDTRDYVFPLLSSIDENTAYKEYQKKFSYYNKTLKELGEKVGIGMPLSSYVARHTWATLAYQSSENMSVISKALGHTNLKTTQIYVKDIGNNKQNATNKKLLKEVLENAPLYKSLNSQIKNRVL